MCEFYEQIMGQPTITRVAGSKNGNGDNELIAAPAAGKKLVLLYLRLQNESANATTAIVKHGTTEFVRALLAQYGAVEREYGLTYPMMLPAATALTLNLSGANAHGYIVEYATIAA